MLAARAAENQPHALTDAAEKHSTRAAVRPLLLVLLLAVELAHFGLPFLPALNADSGNWWWPIIFDGRPVLEGAIGAALVTILFSWPVFADEWRTNLARPTTAERYRWLAIHLACVAAIAAWLMFGAMGDGRVGAAGDLWFFAGILLVVAGTVTWCAALFPFSFWSGWFLRSPAAFALGAATGATARLLGQLTQALWAPLQHYTFWTVALMLQLLGQQVSIEPAQALIGTPQFSVYIAPACSGLEGIGLIAVFLVAYLAFFRDELRFPQSLMLLPVGIALVWLLNSVRITLLILLGGWFDQIAIEGFHSIAGWVFFNATALGLVLVSRQSRFFTQIKSAPEDRRSRLSAALNPASPYLVPLMVTVGVAMVTAAFFRGFDYAYALRVVLSGLALWLYRHRLREVLWPWSWTALAVGVLVCVLWIALERNDAAASSAVFAAGLRRMPPFAALLWLMFRIVGAVITVPLTEELAFRGYLMRKFDATDFAALPYTRVTWPAIIVSSVLFGLLHHNWIAGTLAGIIFAVVVKWRGQLADAVGAHATANATLAIYVIATARWSLWN